MEAICLLYKYTIKFTVSCQGETVNFLSAGTELAMGRAQPTQE